MKSRICVIIVLDNNFKKVVHKMKKLAITSGTVIAVLIAILVALDQLGPVNSTSGLPRIFYTETFEQEGDTYFVYFWRDNCERCAEFQPYVVRAFNDGVPVFVVDMNDPLNQEAWYAGGTYRDAELLGRAGDSLNATHYSQIEIEGTPTVVKIENGVLTERAAGVAPATQLLNTFLN